MGLYSDLFYSAEAESLLAERATLTRMLQAEAALALAQSKAGIIPDSAASIISACCTIDYFDIKRLKSEMHLGGNAAIPMVSQLIRTVKNNDFEASKYVHLGATSQDIVDTALVLAIKDFTVWLEERTDQLLDRLKVLTVAHRSTVMIGRTLLQQAKPITFGLKTSAWLQTILDSKERLAESKKRVLQIQLSGAVGSGSQFLNEKVRAEFGLNLGLENRAPWQTSRGNLVEWLSNLSILTSELGKIAKDISLLMQTEIGEVFEGAASGKGGSTTMPHKRNPVTCSLMIANAHRVPHLLASVMSGMMQEHERSAGLWHAEWEPAEQLMRLAAGSLEKSIQLIENLEVDQERMLQNLEVTQGLIYAENISLLLSARMGKGNAHEWVEKACKLALKEKKHLKKIVEESTVEIEQLDDLFNPLNSIGQSIQLIDQILKRYEDQL
jgi:3-carboxy-cis,cis-muconate cycloisomerase